MKINLKGTQKTIVDIEIDEQDAFRGLENRLRNKYKIGREDWIDTEGFLCEEIDYGHGTPGTKQLAKATPDQKRVLKAIDDFKKLLNKEIKS